MEELGPEVDLLSSEEEHLDEEIRPPAPGKEIGLREHLGEELIGSEVQGPEVE
jgi:hypothetical protein